MGKKKNAKAKNATKDNKNGDRAELAKKEYLEKLEPLQIELNSMARWLQYTGKRLVVLFEGRDTAGKGGAIAAISERMNPRMCHTVALSKPSERESSQWYFQRYVEHLPSAGEIVLFDRSWYNRAGVEKVMGFCNDDQHKAFLKQAPVLEKALVDDGVLIVERCDSAEIELGCAGNRVRFPGRPAVGGADDGPSTSAGPRHPRADYAESAERGGGAALLRDPLPLQGRGAKGEERRAEG